MEFSDEIEIPSVLPVMTLRDTVFFPHTVMPLFIFEPRYRMMLKEVLGSHRLFAVFNEREDELEEGHEEPPAQIGTVGIIRAAHENPDGTSNLALQGLIRVRLLEIVRESPFRMIRVETCPSGNEEEELDSTLRDQILAILSGQPELTSGLPEEYIDVLSSMDQPEPFIDVAIHSLCQDAQVKQRLLETLSLQDRYTVFEQFLLKEQARLELYRRLQGETRDDEIDLN